MIGVVLLSLFVTMIVIVGLWLLMFWDVAFRGSGSRPPGSSSIAGIPAPTPTGCDGVALALRVEQSVSRWVERLGARPQAAIACDPGCGNREVRVTTPEVLAIIHDLRQHFPLSQVDAIRHQACENLASQETHRCPLLLANGSCACAASRPVSCRTHCLIGADSPPETRRLADSLDAGATEIFRDCLNASGLDDSEYELNGALVCALDTPHAARRWALGERILETAASRRA